MGRIRRPRSGLVLSTDVRMEVHPVQPSGAVTSRSMGEADVAKQHQATAAALWLWLWLLVLLAVSNCWQLCSTKECAQGLVC